MDLNVYLEKITALYQGYQWLIVFLIIFVALLFDFIQKIVLSRLHRRTLLTENPWDEAILTALRKPLSALIWIIGISAAVNYVAPKTAFLEYSRDAARAGIILVIAWFCVNLVRQLHDNILEIQRKKGKPVDPTTADAIGKLARISIFITASLMMLQTLGFSISGVLAFGGIGGFGRGPYKGHPILLLRRIDDLPRSAFCRGGLDSLTGQKHRGRSGIHRLAPYPDPNLRKPPPLHTQLDLHDHRAGKPIQNDPSQDL
jgi:hypothetical protein